MTLTPSQEQALKALKDAGGSGVIAAGSLSPIVAAGERLRFDGTTWLRLMTYGLIEPDGHNRIRLSREQEKAR